jgi:two-component sensor histidine kinase
LLARLVPPRTPLPFWKGQVAALAAVAGATSLRWALDPLLGDEVSFTALFPALLVATMYAGAPGGVTTIIAGALASLALSAVGGLRPEIARDIAPRLVVWVLVGSLVAAIALALRATIATLRRRQVELVEARDQLKVVTSELEHRGRNALAIVQGLSALTAREVGSVDAYRRVLSGRLSSLSHAYSLLVAEPGAARALGPFVEQVLGGFGSPIRREGPNVVVSPQVCVALALTLHELATNALKYGALSRPEGAVDVTWTLEPGSALQLRWRETGGPKPLEERVEGVGSRIIRQAFAGLPGACPNLTMSASGVSFDVRLPLLGVPRGGGASG